MLQIQTFQCNMLQENCYVVSDDTCEAVVIDPGMYFDAERQAVTDHIASHGLQLRHVLCTHGHFDHVFGCDTLYDTFSLRPELHADDDFLITHVSQQAQAILGTGFDRAVPDVGHYLSDGETVGFGSHTLRVLHTPGHSPGGVVYYCEEERTAFSGDTLFRMSVGRTDFMRGSWQQLMRSLHDVVATLPPDVTVYTGHGPKTTIGDELRMNPYFSDVRA